MGPLVRVLKYIQLLEALSPAAVHKLPLTSRLFYASWHVSGTFAYSLGSWSHMISTKPTTVISKFAHSQKCVYKYMQDVLCNITECIT